MCVSPLFRIHDDFYDDLTNRVPGLSQVVGRDEYKRLKSCYYLSDDVFQRIPCGQCVECRLKYSKEWAVRCVCESKLYPDNTCWFVTITYDDFHLPVPISILSRKTASTTLFYPLVKKDIQLFIKRLRKRFSGVRYYYCGEYGSKSLRPHFHILLFNLPLSDLIENDSFSHSRISEVDCHKLFESKVLNDCWTDVDGKLKGLIAVAPFSYDTAAYTARYCMKKLKGQSFKDFQKDFVCFNNSTGEVIDFPREFVGMSLKPGIGGSYFDSRLSSIYVTDNLPLFFNKQLNYVRPPRYCDKLAERSGIFLEELKKVREEVAKIYLSQKVSNFSSEEFYLNLQKQLLENRSKRLIRDL